MISWLKRVKKGYREAQLCEDMGRIILMKLERENDPPGHVRIQLRRVRDERHFDITEHSS